MSDLAPFPDPVKAVIDLLADLVANPQNLAMVIPADLQARLADPAQCVIRVRRAGGAGDRITDRARVDVEVFASTYALAVAKAQAVQQRLISRPAGTSHGVIDRASTETGPVEIPYEDQDVRRVSATYRVSMRRRVPAA